METIVNSSFNAGETIHSHWKVYPWNDRGANVLVLLLMEHSPGNRLYLGVKEAIGGFAYRHRSRGIKLLVHWILGRPMTIPVSQWFRLTQSYALQHTAHAFTFCVRLFFGSASRICFDHTLAHRYVTILDYIDVSLPCVWWGFWMAAESKSRSWSKYEPINLTYVRLYQTNTTNIPLSIVWIYNNMRTWLMGWIELP